MMSRIASAFGVVEGPISASTLCSPISFLAFCTARVVSPPSSSWKYSIVASPILAGNSTAVFFCGMPMAEVGPVAETNRPILTWARTGLATTAAMASRIATGACTVFSSINETRRVESTRSMCCFADHKSWASASCVLPQRRSRSTVALCRQLRCWRRVPTPSGNANGNLVHSGHSIDCHRGGLKMRRRLYYVMPDLASARKIMDDLLLARIEERHIHFLAKRGPPMDGLHEANVLQKTDLVHGAQLGLVLGALLGCTAGALLVTFVLTADNWQIITVLGSTLIGA